MSCFIIEHPEEVSDSFFNNVQYFMKIEEICLTLLKVQVRMSLHTSHNIVEMVLIIQIKQSLKEHRSHKGEAWALHLSPINLNNVLMFHLQRYFNCHCFLHQPMGTS